MENSLDASDRTLSISRKIAAPIQAVWDAWANSDQIAQWWGPKGMAVTIGRHKFEVGGDWQYVMPMPNGMEFVSEGKYLEIDEPERIVTTADFKPMTEGVELHCIFEAEGESTNFTFSCVHPTKEYCAQQEEMGFYKGWGSAFDRLESYLAEK